MSLVQAEVLKLVRRRGLMIWSALLAVGSIVVAYTILLSLHAANPAKHGPAGGFDNLHHLVFLVSGLGGITALLIGTTAGSQDVSSGVFRDLVVTGRPRGTLFNARIPGALIVFLPLIAVAFSLAVGGSYAFASGLPTASTHTVVQYGEYVAAVTLLDLMLAVGLAAFASSRVVVGVLLAWNVIVAEILTHLNTLGSARKAIDVAATQHFAPPGTVDRGVTMSTATALLVLVVWIGVALGAGRWWTQRRDA